MKAFIKKGVTIFLAIPKKRERQGMKPQNTESNFLKIISFYC